MTGAAEARPLVSVVIPHLNQPEFLRTCLDSLARQDWPAERTEIIVVDNGSRELPDLAGLGYPHVKLLAEAEPGPGPARNRGIAGASGEFLAFIDADCRADPGWLSAAVAGLTAADSSGVVGGDVRIDFRDLRHLTPLEAYEAVFAYRQKLYIGRHGYSGTGNLAMRREVFDKVGPFGGIHTAEDMDWGQRARAAGHPAAYRADMIVYHPARTSIAELQTKWRRHVAHTLVMHRQRGGSDLAWAARSAMVLASAVPHMAAVLTSPRLSGLGNRLRGIGVLVGIRAFRAGEMLRQRSGSATAGSESWNRPSGG